MRSLLSVVAAGLCCCLSGPIFAGTLPRLPPTQSETVAAYPNSTQGLEQLASDVFHAFSTKDKSRISALSSECQIPDHAAWFLRTFGQTEGAHLESSYSAWLALSSDEPRKDFQRAFEDQKTQIQVEAFEKSNPPSAGLLRAWLLAMMEPVAMYELNSSKAGDKYSFQIGDFVYVHGAFRYLPEEVLLSLSTAPPLRIRIGGNQLVKRMLHMENPHYPSDARKRGVEGTVRLHIVLDTAGNVRDLSVVSGDPTLADAAVEAVRHWKYRPTFLNGHPVEVDSTIDIIFSLPH